MNYSKKQTTSILTYLGWLPVAATFVLLPLLISYRTYESRISSFPWSSGVTQLADLQLYCKQELFCTLSILFLVLSIVQIYKRKQELKNDLRKQWHIWIPAAGYLLLALVSSLCSDYKYSAFYGTDDQFESFFCLAGYLLFCITMFLMIQNEKSIKYVLGMLALLMLSVGIIGILQYSGNDPFLWEWMQKLIMPKGYLETYGSITSTFSEGWVSLASYNPNYAGVLLTLLSSFCFGMLLTERNRRFLLPELVLLLLLVAALVGTGSKAGLLVFAAVVVLALLFQSKKLWKYWKIVIPVIIVVAVGTGTAIHYSKLPIIENLKAALSLEQSEANPLQEMTTAADGVHITYRDQTFLVSYEVDGDIFYVSVTDEAGNAMGLSSSQQELSYRIDKEELSDVTIEPTLVADGLYGMILTMNGTEWTFLALSDCYYYINSYGRLETLGEVERIGFEGYESFATARGLIWSMTLPLLKEHLVLGSGANTFIFEYPQNNYKDSVYYFGEPLVMVRPHSMYLQSAVESGVAATVLLLVFFAWYLIQSIRLCRKSDFTSVSSRTAFACVLAVTAYLVCGLTNDSMITVAPVFWGILGTGLAANHILKKEQKKMNESLPTAQHSKKEA